MNHSTRFESRKTSMINAKAIGFTIAFAIVGTLFLLTGCGGGGGGTSYPNPTLPADAVVFDASNTITYANRAIGDSGYVSTSARQQQTMSSVKGLVDVIISQRDYLGTSSVASGASESQTYNCGIGDGSDGSFTISISGTESSYSGSLNFNNCTELTVTIHGTINFDGSYNSSNSNFTSNGGGSITITDSSDSTKVTMTMRFNDIGNDFDGSFTTDFSFSISGLPGGGFLVDTVQPLQGIGFDTTAGEIMIYGGSNTRIQILITTTNTADVSLDINDGNGLQYQGTITF